MKRSPAAAFWLSLVPGIGHVYLGLTTKGLVLIVSVASAIYLAAHGAGEFFGIMIAFLWLFSMIDAHRSAVMLNHLIDTGQQPPASSDNFAFHKWWGWVLVGIGVVFLNDNYDWFDVDWIWDAWPLAIIALGVYLVKKPTPPVATTTDIPTPPSDAPETDSVNV